MMLRLKGKSEKTFSSRRTAASPPSCSPATSVQRSAATITRCVNIAVPRSERASSSKCFAGDVGGSSSRASDRRTSRARKSSSARSSGVIGDYDTRLLPRSRPRVACSGNSVIPGDRRDSRGGSELPVAERCTPATVRGRRRSYGPARSFAPTSNDARTIKRAGLLRTCDAPHPRAGLPVRFRSDDVRGACPGWADATYSVFLPKHRKGNPGGYTVYFQQNAYGSYSSCDHRLRWGAPDNDRSLGARNSRLLSVSANANGSDNPLPEGICALGRPLRSTRRIIEFRREIDVDENRRRDWA